MSRGPEDSPPPPPNSEGILLNVDNYIFVPVKKTARERDGAEVFYWACRMKCGLMFRTVLENGRHVKDDGFRVTGAHGHAPDSIEYRSPDRRAAADDERRAPGGRPLDLSRDRVGGGRTSARPSRTGRTTEPPPPPPPPPLRPPPPWRPSFRPPFRPSPAVPPELTNTLSGQTFHVRDRGDGARRVIVLSTVRNVRFLSASEFWLINRTAHRTSDRAVRHVYTVHGHVNVGNGVHTCVPLAFGLLASHTADACRAMFAELNGFAREHGVGLAADASLKIITGLETPVVDTVSVTFPAAVHLIGLSHFAKHVYWRIHDEGLAAKFFLDYNFNLLCRHLIAMAFLPVSKIVEGLETIKPLFSDDCREQNLLNYFESTFVTQKSCANVRGPNAEKRPPFFHPLMWSVITHRGIDWSQATHIGESWHQSFNRLLAKQTSLYDSVLQLQHVQNETEFALRNGFEGNISKDYTTTKYLREIYIRDLVFEFKNNSQFSMLLFLKEIACNLNFKNLHIPGQFKK